MKWEQFKNRFRKEAIQEEAEVDAMAIWEAIESDVDALNEDKLRRKPFVFWLFFVGLLLVGGTWILFSLGDAQKNAFIVNEKNETVVLESDEIINPNEELKKTTDLSQADNLTAKNNKDQQPTEIDSKTSVLKQSSNQSAIKKDNTTFSNTQRNEEQLSSASTTNSAEVVNKIVKRQSNVIKIESTNFRPSNTEDLITFKELTAKVTSSFPVAKPKPKSVSATLMEELDFPEIGEVGLLASSSISFLSENRIPILGAESFAQSLFKKELLEEVVLGQKGKAKLQFLVSLDGGVSAINRSLKTRSGTKSVLLNNREEYETPLEAIHYGLSFGLVHQSGFQVSVGLQKTNIAERFDFNETQVSEKLIPGVQALVSIYPGDTLPVMGMIPETTTTISQVKVYNAYTLMDIPVSIGYHYSFKEKWSAGIEGSVLVNLSLKTKGSIAGEFKQEINIEKDQADVFKSKVGLNYSLGLAVGYSFSDKLKMNFSPFVRIFPGDFSTIEYEFSQKYTLVGSSLKLNYQF